MRKGAVALEFWPLADRVPRLHLIYVLPDEGLSPKQIEILRRMTPGERWAVARDLYWTARKHKTAFLCAQNPNWSDQQVSEEVRRLFLYAETRSSRVAARHGSLSRDIL